MNLAGIFKDSNYKLSQFTPQEIDTLEKSITIKQTKSGDVAYINCLMRSNHVNILRIKKENPIYVGFVMNSIIGRLQTEKISSGTAQAELYPKDIENFVIPFISKDKQEEVIKYYIDSLNLKKISHQLLEIAKIGVEKAIETDETTATAWINQQLTALGINSLDE